jgi:O-antigen/teichoic acid export membrane protein
MILATVSAPILVQQWENGSLQRFRKIFLLNAGFLLAISAVPVLIVTMLSPWIMGLYGPAFGEGWLVLVLLLAAAPMHALDKIASSALLGMNRAWWALGINFLWGATLLTLASWLIPAFGAQGLATAFLVTYSIIGVGSVVIVLFGSRGKDSRQIWSSPK